MDKLDFIKPKYFLSEIDSYLCLTKIQYFEEYYDYIFQQTYYGYQYSMYYIEPYKSIPREGDRPIFHAPSIGENDLEVPPSIAESFIKLLHQRAEEITFSLGDIRRVNDSTGYYIHPPLRQHELQPRPLYLYKEISYPRIGIVNNRTYGAYECIEFGRSSEISISNTNDIKKYAPISEKDYNNIRNMILKTTLELYSILAHFYAEHI